MKIIDRFLIKSFIPPFIVAFGIALFVLMMHFLWLYIDELMGKGLAVFELLELLFYLTFVLVPQALPIGVLISTVMVMGNLAEQYELSSLKSAGISLMRVMRPLMLAAGLIAVFSFFTADVLIPWANLKFYSRFYDIRKSKPTVTFEEGVFNDEFSDYTLRIGKKAGDGTSISDVLIYGNKVYNTQQFNQTHAKTGEMMTTRDKQFIVMNLYDGVQNQETSGSPTTSSRTYPFIRIQFKSWQKFFDLSEFDRRKTDEGLFKNNQKMLSSRQLSHVMDSMRGVSVGYTQEMWQNMRVNYTPFSNRKMDTVANPISNVTVGETPSVASNKTLRMINEKIQQNKNAMAQLDSFSKEAAAGTPFAALKPKHDTFVNKKLSLPFYQFLDSLTNTEREDLRNKTEVHTRSTETYIENAIRQVKLTEELRGKYEYELHLKFTYALVCFIFLFIGAPMGAIVQKGGFGYPILVAIVFFMVFMISMIYCKNLKDAAILNAMQAAWIPLSIMLPIAATLTWRAVNDYKISVNAFATGFKNMIQFFKKRRPLRKTAIS